MSSTRCCRAAFVVMLLCCVPALAQLNVLTYRPSDAQYSRALDKLIMVNGSPNQLHIYDTTTNTDTAVNLSYAPTSLSLSVDGRYAAIGHDGKITYMDLATPSGARIFDVPGVNVQDLVLVAGYIYVLPRDTSGTLLRYVSAATGVATNTTIYLYQSYYTVPNLIARPDETGFYFADGSTVRRYNVAGGVPTAGTATYDCSSSGARTVLAEDDRLLLGCGKSLRLLPADAQDLRYRGSLEHHVLGAAYSAVRQEIAAIPVTSSYSTIAGTDTELRLYDSGFLNQTGAWTLPSFVSGTKSVAGRGRFVFYNNAGSRLTVIQQADVSSGLFNDYGIVTYTLGSTCAVTLSTISAVPQATGGSGSVNVDAGNCVWEASSDSAWLRVAGTVRASGNSRLDYYVQPNAASATRTGRITIGNQTLTVSQSGRTGAAPALANLPYRVVDAAYNSTMERAVIVSREPNELHVYDMVNKLDTLVVPLPLRPSSVSLSADGSHALVGHDAWLSRVNLSTGALQSFPVNENVKGVAHGSTHLYSADGTLVRSTEISTGVQTTSATGSAFRLTLGVGGTALFASGSSGPAERYTIAAGPAQYSRSAQGYDAYACSNLWPSADGARLLTACGTALRLSDVAAQDLTYNGRLGQINGLQSVVHVPSRGALFAIPAANYYYSSLDTEIQRIRYDNLAWEATFPLPNLPVDGATVQGAGRFVFASNDGNSLYMILSGSGENSNLFATYSVQVDAHPACSYTISPSPIIIAPNSTAALVTVTTQGPCSWSPSISPPEDGLWTGGGAHRGPGQFYIYAPPNTGPTTKTATLTVAGQTIEIRRLAPADCAIAVSTGAIGFSSSGGSHTVNVTTAAGCPWTASSGYTWVAVQPPSGVGPGSFTVTVAGDAGLLAPRSTSIAVGDRTISVTQTAAVASCRANSVTPTAVGLPANGGSAEFTVNAPAGCPWSAAITGVAWFSAAPSAGTGPGKVTVTAPINSQPTVRLGSMVIDGQTVSINQPPVPPLCTTSMSPSLLSVAATGQSGTGFIQAPCASYRIVSSPAWLQIYPLQGSGASTPITYTVYPNFSTTPRSGMIMFANANSISVSQQPSTATADERLVSNLYFAYLGRYPSAAEVAFHINEGLRKGLTRTDIVMTFFNGVEFNSGGRFVAGLYVGLLNRDAEFGGWLFQRNALVTKKVDQTQIVANFLGSPEWTMRFGSPGDSEFIRLLYRYVLRREAAQNEIEFHLGTLQRGLTRTQMAANFLNVPEFRNGTGPRLSAFLLYACLLGREPTPVEMTEKVAALQAGTPFRTLVDQILVSPEFSALIN